MLNGIMLNAIMLSVIMLNVVAPRITAKKSFIANKRSCQISHYYSSIKYFVYARLKKSILVSLDRPKSFFKSDKKSADKVCLGRSTAMH
jgi:hypothetical protein